MSDIKILEKTLETDEQGLYYLIIWEYKGRKGWSKCGTTQEMINDTSTDYDKVLFTPIIKEEAEFIMPEGL